MVVGEGGSVTKVAISMSLRTSGPNDGGAAKQETAMQLAHILFQCLPADVRERESESSRSASLDNIQLALHDLSDPPEAQHSRSEVSSRLSQVEEEESQLRV